MRTPAKHQNPLVWTERRRFIAAVVANLPEVFRTEDVRKESRRLRIEHGHEYHLVDHSFPRSPTDLLNEMVKEGLLEVEPHRKITRGQVRTEAYYTKVSSD